MLNRIAALLKKFLGRPSSPAPRPARRVPPAATPVPRPSGATPKPQSLSEEDVRLLERSEGGHTYRRSEVGVEDFDALVGRLRDLRARGLLRLDDGRIMHAQDGGYLMAGPCDLTEAGRSALEHDRRLGPRAPQR